MRGFFAVAYLLQQICYSISAAVVVSSLAEEVADPLAISELQPDLAAVLARRGSYDGVASA